VTKSQEIEVKKEFISIEKAGAEEALTTAMPALETARLALGDLDKRDISEIRSFVSPPKPVQVICECIAILRGVKEVNWKNAKGLMADPQYLFTLKNMNCNLITTKQQAQVKTHLKVLIYYYSKTYDKRLTINYW
jgi:dynein heavy chain